MRIGFVGVGKLGQACAEVMAEKHDVIGYDVESRKPDNFTMSETLAGAVLDRDLVFVAVPTPHDPAYDGCEPTSHLPNRDFDYAIARETVAAVDALCNSQQTIVLISTVLPGTVRREIEPLIINAQFVYNPYLIAMGTVKWDATHPEMIMMGTRDGAESTSTALLRELYASFVENDPPVHVGTWDECESLKVFYNTFISMKISLVNMIQDVAERLGNIDVDFVTRALSSSDRRILGPAYMRAGMGDGGACHPRDNIALRWMAEDLGLGYDLFGAIMHAREVQAQNMANFLLKTAGQLPIVIMGRTYKPLVPYTNGSSSMLVGHFIEREGHPLYYLDLATSDVPPTDLGPAVYLLAHSAEVTYGDQLDQVQKWHQEGHTVSSADRAFTLVDAAGTRWSAASGSTIVDPWRSAPTESDTVRVIHYGNTRGLRSQQPTAGSAPL